MVVSECVLYDLQLVYVFLCVLLQFRELEAEVRKDNNNKRAELLWDAASHVVGEGAFREVRDASQVPRVAGDVSAERLSNRDVRSYSNKGNVEDVAVDGDVDVGSDDVDGCDAGDGVWEHAIHVYQKELKGILLEEAKNNKSIVSHKSVKCK